MKNKKSFIFLIIIISLFIVIGIIKFSDRITITGNATRDSYQITKVSSEQDFLNNCKNLNLVDTAKCMSDNVKPIFRYVERAGQYYINGTYRNSCMGDECNNQEFVMKAERIRDISDIIKNGGVCRDWARLYSKIAKDLGFYSEIVSMDTTEDRGHAVALISNKEGYCVLDQKENPLCFLFNGENNGQE